MAKKQLNVNQSCLLRRFKSFNALDHVFHTNIIAYCQENQYVRLTICIDLSLQETAQKVFGTGKALDFRS